MMKKRQKTTDTAPYWTRLREVLSCPTAPFCEQAVMDYVRGWAKERKIQCREDEWGNLWLQAGRKNPTWIIHAHVDHPGFVAVSQRGRRVTADFRGHVQKEYFIGSKMEFFTPLGSIPGAVRTTSKSKKNDFMRCGIELDEPANIAPGALGMWRVPACRRRGERISARACDDLSGLAAILCMFESLPEGKNTPPVAALLTRAEEVGFAGMIGAVRSGEIPRSAMLVGLETSKAQPAAPLGGGVVIRVGDRIRTFDPDLTAHIVAAAEKLMTQDRQFRYQRCLMPGGACETTALALASYQAAALCLPLGNYHNMHPSGKIAAEQIDFRDFTSMVKLLVAVSASPKPDRESISRELNDHLEKNFENLRKYF